ncbi:hypothetical protein [Falsiroseomonas sp. E2-1-a4]|uniref:hypothetical protein n=1 Tax=Falsiroseomonas sp. E2-1-a4 TaxID=3239299 RepID=UPI003F3E0A3A
MEGCASVVLDVCAVMRPVTAEIRRQQAAPIAEGQIAEASAIRWNWTWQGDAAPWATVDVHLSLCNDHGSARLSFDVAHYHCPTGLQQQTVMIEATPSRFGGVRWWWVCPATGRRCAKIYLPDGGIRFLSRGQGAYRLAYASQRGDDMQRSHGRLARLHRRLGGRYRFFDEVPPPRPKWMRHATYDRLWAEWEAQIERHEGIYEAGAARLRARL